jgi:hypothetical protein
VDAVLDAGAARRRRFPHSNSKQSTANTSDVAEPGAPPERVWQSIGGFHSLPDWLPYIASSVMSEGGRVRALRSASALQLLALQLRALPH